MSENAICSCGDTLGDVDPRCPVHFPSRASNRAQPAPPLTAQELRIAADGFEALGFPAHAMKLRELADWLARSEILNDEKEKQ